MCSLSQLGQCATAPVQAVRQSAVHFRLFTSHITNQRDTFVTYEPIQNTPITGVGGLQAQAEGRSDVNIITSYDGTSYPICLCDVLYIPGNKNNLSSLGRWIAKGGDFMG